MRDPVFYRDPMGDPVFYRDPMRDPVFYRDPVLYERSCALYNNMPTYHEADAIEAVPWKFGQLGKLCRISKSRHTQGHSSYCCAHTYVGESRHTALLHCGSIMLYRALQVGGISIRDSY